MSDLKNNPIISLHKVNFGYKKSNLVLRDISFQIFKKEIIALAGISGIGKTTLGYILKGIIPHSIKGYLTGEIIVAGFNIKKKKISYLAKSIGMVFQNLNAQLFNTTVLDEVQFGLRNLGLNLEWAKEAMEFLGIWDLKDQMPMNLSAGQKQRVVLASIIAMHPQVLILDEPSAHLDIPSRKGLKNLLLKLNQEFGTTIIIIEQDPWLVGELCTDILFLNEKGITREDKMNLIQKRPSWRWIFDEN